VSEELDQKIEAVVSRLNEVSDRIAARFTTEFSRMKTEGSPELFDPRWGFVDKTGAVTFEVAPIKYAVHGRRHLKLKLRYLPLFSDLKSAYDIGVGSGQMFMLLRDALGIRTRGLDAENVKGAYLYREFRRELGIDDAVDLFEIRLGSAIPIPQGVDAVLALWPTFDRGWGPSDHDWFVNLCRSRGAKRLVWRFNMGAVVPETLSFYEQAGAEYPWPQDRGFLFLTL